MLTFLSIVSYLAVATPAEEGTVIGIVGVPYTQGCDTLHSAGHKYRANAANDTSFTCMTIYYSKWIEQSAARSIGITYNMYDTSKDLLDSILDGVNGVLFTGGGLLIEDPSPPEPVAQYMRTLEYIMNTSAAKFEAGVNFPVWGTCMGLQSISIIAGHSKAVVETGAFDSEDISLPVSPRDVANSRLFDQMPDHIYEVLTKDNVTANLHHDGVTPATFLANSGLQKYHLLGTSFDRKGKEFVAMMEHKEYPIFAVQYHPERPAYEWTSGHNFNRSSASIHVMRYLSDFLISEAAKNSQVLSGVALEYAEGHATSGMDSHEFNGGRLTGSRLFTFFLKNN